MLTLRAARGFASPADKGSTVMFKIKFGQRSLSLILGLICMSSATAIGSEAKELGVTSTTRELLVGLLASGITTEPRDRYASYREMLHKYGRHLLSLHTASESGQIPGGQALSFLGSTLNPEMIGLLSEMVDLSKLPDGLRQLLLKLEPVSNLLTPMVKKAHELINIPEEHLDALDSHINSIVFALRLSRSKAIRMLLNEESGLDLSDLPMPLADFLRLVLEKYFDHLSNQTKRSILVDIILAPKKT